ncbi:hypothetical protein GCM10025877_33500 [Agromyces mangrovi Wang et al. 2018]|nr:hypothetical protein GCM10025877_33500 [Agromyces mangrovi]
MPRFFRDPPTRRAPRAATPPRPRRLGRCAVAARIPASHHLTKGSNVLAVHDLEIRVGARVLMEHVNFRVADGDKIGLVGRNGAGKTTLTKVLAGRPCRPTDASTVPARSVTCPRTPARATPSSSRARASSTRADSVRS